MKKKLTLFVTAIAMAMTLLAPTTVSAAGIDMDDYVLTDADYTQGGMYGLSSWPATESCTYDKYGNLTKKYTTTDDSYENIKYKNTYKKGKLIKVVETRKYKTVNMDSSVTKGTEKKTTEYTYSGNLLAKVVVKDGDGNVVSSTTYKKGLLTKEMVRDDNGNFESTTYQYKKGLLTKVTVKNGSGKLVEQTTHSYTDGIETKQVVKTYYEGVIYSKITNTYTYKKGNLIKDEQETTYYVDGKVSNTYTDISTYTYKKGKLTKSVSGEETVTYQYAENGNLESKKEVNPYMVTTTTYYTSGKFTGLVKKIVYTWSECSYVYKYKLSKDKSTLTVTLLSRENIGTGEPIEGTWTYTRKTW